MELIVKIPSANNGTVGAAFWKKVTGDFIGEILSSYIKMSLNSHCKQKRCTKASWFIYCVFLDYSKERAIASWPLGSLGWSSCLNLLHFSTLNTLDTCLKGNAKRAGTVVWKPHHGETQKQPEHELRDLQEAEPRSNYLTLSRKASREMTMPSCILTTIYVFQKNYFRESTLEF